MTISTNGHAATDYHRQRLADGAACLEAALEYRRRGWPPLACCPPDHVGVGRDHGKRCASPGKRPWHTWKEYQGQLPTEDEIRSWWHQQPAGNVGVALGPLGGIVRVDVDGPGGERLLAELSQGDLPPTLEFTSGRANGGRGILYAIPPGVTFKTTFEQPDKKEELRFQALGAQTVLPPSRHPDGNLYSWLPGHGPGEVELAPAPAWVVSRWSAAASTGRAKRTTTTTANTDRIAEGGRNATLTSLAGTMRRRGFSRESIEAALLQENATRCEPPLDDDEVRVIAEHVAAYAPHETNGKATAAGESHGTTTGPGVANGMKDDQKNTIPFTMAQIMSQAATATGDWPRRVGTTLFVHEGEALAWIDNSAALFGYYGSKSGIVRWYKGLGCHSKEEVFAERRRTAPGYQAVEVLPHEPPMPGHYYACATPRPGDGKALAELLSRFRPTTVLDLDLLRALWATALWGGAGGTRPAFVITSKHGRGSGKSKLVTMLAHTFGGFIDLAADEDVEVVKQRLLSPDGITKRIALLDNVKSWKFSRAEYEALVTAPTISGKRLYVGEASRPNTLTWVITLNGVSLGADMSQRSVIIEIDRPERSGTWEEDTYRFIDANRERLIADVLTFLRSPRGELAQFSRWASWERDILSRLPEPADAQRLILERQGAADVEQEEHDIIEGFFRERLQRLGYNPDTDRIRIPTAIAARWVNWSTNENQRTPTVSRMLNAAIEADKFRCIRRDASRALGRCFLWCGPQADAEQPTCNNIEDRIGLQGDPKPIG